MIFAIDEQNPHVFCQVAPDLKPQAYRWALNVSRLVEKSRIDWDMRGDWYEHGWVSPLPWTHRDRLTMCRELNLPLILSLAYWPEWAMTDSAYRDVVSRIIDEVTKAGVKLLAVAPWNEPNLSVFMSPQRDTHGIPLSPARYAHYFLLAVNNIELPPGAVWLAGELAGDHAATSRNDHRISIQEFVDYLPPKVRDWRDFSLHDYTSSSSTAAGATDAFVQHMAHRHKARPRVWVTEAGARWPSGQNFPLSQFRDTVHWWRNHPQVHLVTQYTARTDPTFPCGVLSSDGRTHLLSYDVWRNR